MPGVISKTTEKDGVKQRVPSRGIKRISRYRDVVLMSFDIYVFDIYFVYCII